jgi:hypothetical protein
MDEAELLLNSSRLLSRIAGSLEEAEKHRGCLEPPSRIGGSLEEASDIEDV